MCKFINYSLLLLIILFFNSCKINVSGSDDEEEGGNINYPPDIPQCYSPAINDTGISLTPLLCWNCNTYNDVRFDVYLDTNSYPYVMIASDIFTRDYYIYQPLKGETIYYWKIKAKNNYGESVSSTVSFKTTSAGAVDGGPVVLGTDVIK